MMRDRPRPEDDFPLPFPDPPSEPPDPIVLELAIEAPAHGSTVSGRSNGATFTVSGTASVPSGGGTVAAVEISFGGGDFVPANADAPGFARWSRAFTAASAGGVSIVVRAWHSSGLTKQAQVDVAVEITADPPAPDTVAPTLTITAPLTGEVIVGEGQHEKTVTVAGTASDGNGFGVAEVQVLVDGVPAAVEALAPDWSRWKAEVELVGLGPHVVSAIAIDAVGLRMEVSRTLRLLAERPTRPLAERLFLVEKCRLSTFLGAYGAGRTIRTVCLLPGQRDTISVKTYKRTSEAETSASSILDSYTKESEEDFESTLSREQSSKQASDESLKWDVKGQGQANWGVGSASLTAGASGGTNGSREELSKNIATAVRTHAAKASAKREIDIRSSREVKTEAGEEHSTQTEIENINVSRTLNFTFRQMNQEFISLLHLVDVRIGYLRIDRVEGTHYTLEPGAAPFVLDVAEADGGILGDAVAVPAGAGAPQLQAALDRVAKVTGAASVVELGGGTYRVELERPADLSVRPDPAAKAILRRETTRSSYREVTLSQLDGLLRQVIVPERVKEVRDEIVATLRNVFDYRDEPHAMVEEKVLTGPGGAPLPNGSYLRVPLGKTSTYVDPATGTKVTVPGLILAAMKNVMRTDGVVCDAILGHGLALDDYSLGLQQEAVKAKELENDLQRVRVAKERLALKLVEAGNAAAAGVFETVYAPGEDDDEAVAAGNGAGA